MARSEFIDWGSPESHLILNPKLPELLRRNAGFQKLPARFSHIWIASSGSDSSALTLYALGKSAFLISAVAVNSHLQVKKKDIWLNVLPLFHVGGLSIYARAFLSGSKVIDRSSENWGAEKFHVWANDSLATLTSLVPTQLYDLVRLGKTAPKSLRAIVIGGAKLDRELYACARQLGFPVLPSYGLTECCSQVATASLDSLASENYPELEVLSHVEVHQTPEGRLAVKTPALFTAQARCFTDHTEVLWRVGDWFITQDLAEVRALPPEKKSSRSNEIRVEGDTDVTANGQILIPLGRAADQVKISGELVDLNGLQDILRKIIEDEQIQVQALLFAQPSVRRGSEIALALNIADFPRAEKWINRFNSEVLPVAKINSVYFVNEIPRSELGKVKAGELKAILGLDSAFRG